MGELVTHETLRKRIAKRDGIEMTLATVQGSIRLQMGSWELWLSPSQAMTLADDLSERALDALAEGHE